MYHKNFHYLVLSQRWAQYGLSIFECDFIFHTMVLHEKYTLLMSQKHKYCDHLKNFQTLTLVKVSLLCWFNYLITLKQTFFQIFCKILFENILRRRLRKVALLILMLTVLYLKFYLLEVILNISGLFQYPIQSII